MLEYEFDCVIIATDMAWADDIRYQCIDMGIAIERIIFPLRGMIPLRLNDVCEHNGIRIKTSYIGDMFVFSEILLLGIYPPPPKKNDYVLVDIGMNVGVASLYYASFPNVKAVYSYEPLESAYQKAIENFMLNPEISQKIIAHPFGLEKENMLLSLNDHYKRQMVVDCTIKKASETLREVVSSCSFSGGGAS
jgi:hypothetical protein